MPPATVWRVTAIAVAAGVAVAAGACLQSATGFGFSLIAAPLLFAATEPEHAVGLLIVLGAEMNLLTLATEGRRPAPLRREAALILVWGLPGALAGVAVLRALDAVALQLAVTVGVLVSLALRWRTRRTADEHPSPAPWWSLPATGLSAGALTTSTTTAGPPLVLYLLHRDARPIVVRDTLTVCFLGLSILGAIALFVTGTSGARPEGTWLAALVPVVAVGHLAGRPVFTRIAHGRYEGVLTGVLLVACAAGLVTALV
jgi:uncharacterized membrane protein YfcA